MEDLPQSTDIRHTKHNQALQTKCAQRNLQQIDCLLEEFVLPSCTRLSDVPHANVAEKPPMASLQSFATCKQQDSEGMRLRYF